jgi:hypothetical protein
MVFTAVVAESDGALVWSAFPSGKSVRPCYRLGPPLASVPPARLKHYVEQ